jgi:UDP-2-acetamido-2-deoxy-ribo-hexuluronate aminotransferase
MQLVFDADVLVDALLLRGECFRDTLDILESVKVKKIEGWVLSHTIPTIVNSMESVLKDKGCDQKESKKTTSDFVEYLLSFVKIIPQTGNDFKHSIAEFSCNYDEYLIARIAKKYLPNPIIVSTKKTFEAGDVDVKHPTDIKLILDESVDTVIDFANLKLQQRQLIPQIEANISQVVRNCNFIMGEEVAQLEGQLEKFTSVKHAITCASGTDALLLAMMAIDIQPDDEIITTPFTFIATAETVALMKAKPVFVDIEEDTYNIDATKIEAAITKKTKAIIPVSLYGQPADMDAIQVIADKYNLKVIIDGAQSFGATYKGKMDSNIGDISITSFFPAKPLGCYGDGGAIFTNNDDYAEKMKMIRVHGQNKRYYHQYIGIGGRLDTIQAAILLAKLPHYEKEIKMRQDVAKAYTETLQPLYSTPVVKKERTSVWAQYTLCVENRDFIQKSFKAAGIPSAVHYPMPLHLQQCFSYLGYKKGDFSVSEKISKRVISLPMNPFISMQEISSITKNILINKNSQ